MTYKLQKIAFILVFGFGISRVAASVNFSYDSLNRLTKADYGNGLVFNYTYDAAGNRLTEAVTATPQITIEQPVGASLTSNSSVMDYGSVLLGSNSPKVFTIKNTGVADLVLGTIAIDGTNSAEFVKDTTNMLTTITPGGSTTFNVNFTPGGLGLRTSALHIASNDLLTNPFNLSLLATSSLAATSPATAVTSGWATLNGMAYPNGKTGTAYFQYGTSASYGTNTYNFALGSGTAPVPVSFNTGGLLKGTTYHYRTVLTNADGTYFGNDQTFTTPGTISPAAWHYSPIGTVSNVTGGERMAVYNPNWNHIYYRGTDGRIWACYSAGGSWISTPLGTQSNVAGSLAFNGNWNHVYYRGTDGRVWACLINNGAWINVPLGSAANVGGELVVNPNWNHIYYRATDGTTWACYPSGGIWVSQQLVGGTAGGSWTFNPIWNHLVHRDATTGGLSATYAGPSGWTATSFGALNNVTANAGIETSRIGFNPNRNTIFYQGADNQVWATYVNSGNWFQGSLGGAVGGPLVVNTVWNIVQYLGQDGKIWATSQDSNGNWVSGSLGDQANATSPLLFGSQWNHVYYRGADGNLWALHYD